MICDKIENLACYETYAPYISAIDSFLSECGTLSLAPGKHEINDDIFVNVEEYAPGDNTLFEAHREYIDLQYLVEGDEEIAVVPISDTVVDKEYDANIEAGFYTAAPNAPEFKLFMQAGTFAIFEPRDAHCPGKKYRAGKVKKLIFKIKIG